MPRTFVLTVDRDIKLFTDTAAHLDAQGIEWERFNGVDNQIMRLTPVDTFDVDRVGEKIAPKHVAACLSHYLLWKVMSYLPEDEFIVFEYDVRLPADFRERYEAAMRDVPDDYDMIFLGSCCCEGRESKHIAGDVYEVKYPLCGHAIQYSKKALKTLLSEGQKIWAPLDIALYYGALRKLKVYTVLPELVSQHGTFTPP